MKILWLIISTILSSYLVSSYADTAKISPAEEYINSITLNLPSITPADLRTMLAVDKNEVVLLDVRTFFERDRTKSISGDKEIHIPRGFLEVKAWGLVPKDKPVIIYCSKGTRSKLAVKTLQEMGWTNTASLEGGVKAWYESVNEPCGCLPEKQEIPDKEGLGSCKP